MSDPQQPPPSWTIEPELVLGEQSAILMTDADGTALVGQTLRALHRPDLSDSHEVAIGITDGMGRVRWQPDLAGVTRLSSEDHELWVSIQPANLPSDTLSLLAAALLMCVLAAAHGLRRPRSWRPPGGPT